MEQWFEKVLDSTVFFALVLNIVMNVWTTFTWESHTTIKNGDPIVISKQVYRCVREELKPIEV